MVARCGRTHLADGQQGDPKDGGVYHARGEVLVGGPTGVSRVVDPARLPSGILHLTSYLLPLTSYILHITSYILHLTSYILPG